MQALLIVVGLSVSACGGGIGGGAQPASVAILPATPTASTGPTPIATSQPGEIPMQADLIADAVGVNTHFDYQSSAYVTAFSAQFAALTGSGIRHVRDGVIGSGEYGDRLTMLGEAGIKHSLQFNAGTSATDMVNAIATYAPYVEFVEPQNELDADNDPNYVADLQSEQQTLATAIRSDPQASGVAVLGPSFAGLQSYALLGNLDSDSDFGNLHNATCAYNPGVTANVGILEETAYVSQSTTKPIWTTETGYNDDLTKACAIPDDVIAKYDPRDVTERILDGEPRVYFYELTDEPNEQVFDQFGLTDVNGNPKPQLIALQSMIHAVADPGTTFAPVPLVYSFAGATQNMHHILSQKRDGTYVMLLWLEVPSWTPNSNNVGGVRVSPSAQTVTVSFGKSFSTASVLTYNSTWTLSSAPLALSSNSITVPVSDTISFVEFK